MGEGRGRRSEYHNAARKTEKAQLASPQEGICRSKNTNITHVRRVRYHCSSAMLEFIHQNTA